MPFRITEISSPNGDLVTQSNRNVFEVRLRPDVLHKIFPIEQVGIHPHTAVVKQPPAFAGKVIFTKMHGHLFRRSQRAEIPARHLGVRPEIFDIHRVVLTAFHHPITIGIPSAFNPAELECPTRTRPLLTKELLVARQLPIAEQLHDAAHLPIGSSNGKFLGSLTDWKDHAVRHAPIRIGGIAEFHIAHRPCEITK